MLKGGQGLLPESPLRRGFEGGGDPRPRAEMQKQPSARQTCSRWGPSAQGGQQRSSRRFTGREEVTTFWDEDLAETELPWLVHPYI